MNYLTIKLTRGYEAKIDYEDQHLVGELWRALTSRTLIYAVTGTPPEMLHRRIANPPPGMVVDHINGDTLDNRRSNLRVVTPQQNKLNVAGSRRDSASGILGVRQTKEGRWLARIMIAGKSHYLGTFDDRDSATQARLKAERELHGIQPRRAHLHG